MPRLSELIARAGIAAKVGGDVEITGVTTDSRAVTPGALFLAVSGASVDGTKFISEALAKGAAAVLSPSDVPDMREAVAKIAAAFYPQQPTHCYAVTGTDGKTSTADFVRQLASLSGKKSASVGTLGLRSDDEALNAQFPALNTSPEPILLHRMLQALAVAGVEEVCIETSSHGLDQKRGDGVKFTAGAFTNLARDHLDYHATVEEYFKAKARLFTLLPQGAVAVLNRDDARFGELETMCESRGLKIVSFGAAEGSDYRIARITPTGSGLDAVVAVRGVDHTLSLPFYGAFQLSNMLTAIGLMSAHFAEEKLLALLPKLQGVPGRLERIALHHGAPVFIDYAHTPAALENILKVLRPHTQNKLHVVFGCGGDRDPGKRLLMGEAAARLADHVIITDDNPRSEDAAAIRAAVQQGAPNAENIAGREQAIRAAINQLKPGDVLVVAGKGHETTQTIGSRILPFNDAMEIRKAIAA